MASKKRSGFKMNGMTFGAGTGSIAQAVFGQRGSNQTSGTIGQGMLGEGQRNITGVSDFGRINDPSAFSKSPMKQDKPVPKIPKKDSIENTQQYKEGTKKEQDLMLELEGINNDMKKVKADTTIDSKRKKQLLKTMKDAAYTIDNQMWSYD